MLKSTTTKSDDHVRTIGVAGLLTPSRCQALEQAISAARDRQHKGTINLAHIRLDDQSSVE